MVKTISKVAAVVATLSLILPVSFGSVVNAAPGDITGLWNTGVDANGQKLSQGATDPHWTLVGVDNPESGAPHCQQGTFPRPATVTGANILNPNNVAVWEYNPTDATWIGANNTGLHDSTVACPEPSDESDGSLPNAGARTDTDTWPYWNYRMTDFTIDPTVDLSTVQIATSAIADNFLYVSVNGTQILEVDSSVTGYQNPNPVQSEPISGVFKHGANTMTVRVKSGYSNAGFVISQLVATAKLRPMIEVTKTTSKKEMTVGKAENFTIKVTNSGTADKYAATSGTITVMDTIPDELTIGKLPEGCSANGQVVTCTSTKILRPETSDELSFVIPVTAKTDFEIKDSTVYAYGGNSINCLDNNDCPATVAVLAVPAAPNTASTIMKNPFIVALGAIVLAGVSFFAIRGRKTARN